MKGTQLKKENFKIKWTLRGKEPKSPCGPHVRQARYRLACPDQVVWFGCWFRVGLAPARARLA